MGLFQQNRLTEYSSKFVMAISDKTRKLLWGRSGNRCAICHRELVMDATAEDDESIVGDECHIIARSPDGPRGTFEITDEFVDRYSNLILLCKIHHKMIDDQHKSYTAEKLQALKRDHEQWVRNTLGPTNNRIHIAPRIRAGKDLLSLVIGADASSFIYDEPENEEELALISQFIQRLQDWGDFGWEIEVSARIQAAFQLSRDIAEIEQKGLGVFGLLIFDEIECLSVAMVKLARLPHFDNTEAAKEAV